MHFLGNLGIDLWLLLAQIANFLLLLYALTKFVYRPIMKQIEADEAELLAIQTAREDLTQREQQLVQKEQRYLTRTRDQARAIITEAEEVADSMRERARGEAAEEKQAVIAQIHKRLHEAESYSHD